MYFFTLKVDSLADKCSGVRLENKKTKHQNFDVETGNRIWNILAQYSIQAFTFVSPTFRSLTSAFATYSLQ